MQKDALMQKGAYTLLITPFKEDLSLDEGALKKLVQRQVDAGIHGIAPLGVTGENTLLTEAELKRVLEIVVEGAKGKATIVPDTCVTSTWQAIERAKLFADLGADYVSVFAPFFVLPKAEGVIDFYEKVADASPVPIAMHNSKGRTGINMEPETTAKLAKHPNIIGIKDGNKQLDHLAKVIYLTKMDDFVVLTGKDTTAYPMISFGGAGSFSVAGNVIPKVMKKMCDFALSGDLENAQKMHYDYYPLFEALRFETNPMAAKKALELMGLITGKMRSPLTELSDKKSQLLKIILEERGLI